VKNPRYTFCGKFIPEYQLIGRSNGAINSWIRFKMEASGHFENFKWPYHSNISSNLLHFMFQGGVFWDGRLNGAISSLIKFKMVAGISNGISLNHII